MTKNLIFIILSLLTWGIGEGAFMYFQPLYLEQLGASPLVIGGILGGVGLVITILQIPAGYLSDRFGRRKLIWAAWLMGIITVCIMAAAKTLLVFSAGIILYSVTFFVMAPLNSYVIAARNKLSVERAITITSASFNFGAIIGPLVGGVLAGKMGLRAIYFFAFMVFIISGLLILQIKPQAIENNPGNPAEDLINNKQFLTFLPFAFLIFFSLFFPQPLTPNFLKNQREISLQTIGILGSITSLGTVFLNILFGFIPPQIGLVLGQLFVGLFSVLVWQTTEIPLLAAAFFMYGGARATRSLVLAQVGKLVKRANLGLAFGVTETIAGLSWVAGPPLAGVLYSKNPTLIFSTTLLLLIPSVLLTLTRRKIPWKP
ncbi:MAG: MFS transporter [Anaerolineales bacterium]